MNKCSICNTRITLLNTKGASMSEGSKKTTIRRCGGCYLKWKREERGKNGKS